MTTGGVHVEIQGEQARRRMPSRLVLLVWVLLFHDLERVSEGKKARRAGGLNRSRPAKVLVCTADNA